MEAATILKWTSAKDVRGEYLLASTLIGSYGVRRSGKTKWRWEHNDRVMGYGFNSADDATLDAERDYVNRCCEHLPMFNPFSHIVVSREAGEVAVGWGNGIADVSLDDRAALAELRAALEEEK